MPQTLCNQKAWPSTSLGVDSILRRLGSVRSNFNLLTAPRAAPVGFSVRRAQRTITSGPTPLYHSDVRLCQTQHSKKSFLCATTQETRGCHTGITNKLLGIVSARQMDGHVPNTQCYSLTRDQHATRGARGIQCPTARASPGVSCKHGVDELAILITRRILYVMNVAYNGILSIFHIIHVAN